MIATTLNRIDAAALTMLLNWHDSETRAPASDEGKKAIENVERLRAALKPFADEANEWKRFDDTENIVEPFPGVSSDITVGDLRRAREAMGESK